MGLLEEKAGEPVAEKMLLGQTLMGNGSKNSSLAYLVNKPSHKVYKKL